MPAPYDDLWVGSGGNWVKPNIAYVYNGQAWRRVKKVYVSNGVSYDLVAEYPDWGKVASGITSAVAGTAPHAAIFNESIGGRKFGDIDNNGTVNAVDALRATQFNSYALAAGAQKTYLEDVISGTMMRNKIKYADYF
jgi:hypothetical protein